MAIFVLHYFSALDYLISNGSVVEEDERAYLKKLYEAEVNICTTVADMIESEEAFSFDTDFETEPLKTLASDPDQVGLQLQPESAYYFLYYISTVISLIRSLCNLVF